MRTSRHQRHGQRSGGHRQQRKYSSLSNSSSGSRGSGRRSLRASASSSASSSPLTNLSSANATGMMLTIADAAAVAVQKIEESASGNGTVESRADTLSGGVSWIDDANDIVGSGGSNRSLRKQWNRDNGSRKLFGEFSQDGRDFNLDLKLMSQAIPPSRPVSLPLVLESGRVCKPESITSQFVADSVEISFQGSISLRSSKKKYRITSTRPPKQKLSSSCVNCFNPSLGYVLVFEVVDGRHSQMKQCVRINGSPFESQSYRTRNRSSASSSGTSGSSSTTNNNNNNNTRKFSLADRLARSNRLKGVLRTDDNTKGEVLSLYQHKKASSS